MRKGESLRVGQIIMPDVEIDEEDEEVGICIFDDGTEKTLVRYGDMSCRNTLKSSTSQY